MTPPFRKCTGRVPSITTPVARRRLSSVRRAEAVWLHGSAGMALLLLLALLALPGPAEAAPKNGTGVQGTIDTIAGPEYCAGSARLASRSRSVRALAIGPAGEIAVDTGPPGEGLLGTVDRAGIANVLRTGTPVGPDPSRRGVFTHDLALPASRLASDGQGGFFAAAGTRIDHVTAPGPGVSLLYGALAGSRPGGSGGDGGPARGARFARVASVATDTAGNLFIADLTDARRATFVIRFVNRGRDALTIYGGTGHEVTVQPGHIETIAGMEGSAGTGAVVSGGASARRSALSGLPPSMAIAGERLYVATYSAARSGSRSRSRVSMINLGADPMDAHGVRVGPGAIAVVAGGERVGYGGDGGPALLAAMSYIPGLAADADGNLYLADSGNHRVRKVDGSGTITTFAGDNEDGRSGFNGNDRPATSALLDRPYDVEVGPRGWIYIADQFNGQVRVVDPAGTIRAARGNGLGMTWLCDGASDRPRPATPSEITAGGDSVVYVAARGTNAIMPSGRVSAVASRLAKPTAVATRPGGGLYVADAATSTVSLVNTATTQLRAHGVVVDAGKTRVVTAIPGHGAGEVPGGLATVGALVADEEGNLFLSGEGGVQLLDHRGRITAVKLPPAPCPVAGDLATGPSGILYIGGGHRVCVFNRGSKLAKVHGQAVPPGRFRPVAGSGDPGFSDDGGDALAAQLTVGAVAIGRGGDLFIADPVEQTVRKVDRAGTIRTVAGTGQFGFNGDGLKGRLSALHGPSGVAVDRCGNLLIADSQNGRVRRLNLAESCDLTSPGDGGDPAASWLRRNLVAALLIVGALGAAAVSLLAVVRRRSSGGLRRRPHDHDERGVPHGVFTGE